VTIPHLTAASVDAAAKVLADVLPPTPLHRSERLSAATGADVWLKREDLQPVRSYKLRGAFNFISGLSDEEGAKGVVAASAGNHAQGVAFAGQRLGVRSRIYLPRNTPRQKRDRVAILGGDLIEVIVTGEVYDDAAKAAAEDAARTGAVVVPAFDALDTMAGQGTVAIEIVQQLGKVPDLVTVPVGGGGLLGGMATWMAAHTASTRLVGVEPEGAASMAAALAAGAPVDLDEVSPFVDGAAVRRVGTLTHAAVAATGTHLTSVSEGALCVEMLAMYQTDGIIAEPAGALATTVLADLRIEPGSTVVAVVSGGNNDVSRYAEIVEKALIHEGRKHYFTVDFPQEPGALRRFLDEVLGPDDDITFFDYIKRNNRDTGTAIVGLELGDPDELRPLLARMDASPLGIERIPTDSPLFRLIG
jgi:threonine dehydratase